MSGLSVNAWPTCIAWLNECNNCWWDGICISDLPKYMVIRWVPVSRSLEDNKYILSIITSQNTLLKIHKNSFWKRKCAVCHPKWMNEWTEHLSCHLKKNGRATIPFSEDDRTSLQRFAQHLGVYLQKTLKFYDVFITQFRLFWHHCDVAGCSVEKKIVCCTALSMPFHMTYYSIWVLEIFFQDELWAWEQTMKAKVKSLA